MSEENVTINFLKKLPNSSGEDINKPSSFGTPMTAESALQTPTTSATQSGVSFNVDRSGEAANKSSFRTPMAVESALQTPATSATQTCVSFNADRSVKSPSSETPMTVEYALKTCVDNSYEAINTPSSFGTPMTAGSALKTPTTNATQKSVSFNVDDLNEANKSSFFGTLIAAGFALKTPTTSATQTGVFFNDDRSSEATNQPSLFGTPMDVESALETPTTDSSQKSVSVNVDDSNEANKPSSVETPMAVESASKTPTTSATQRVVSFNADRSGEAINQPSLFGTPMDVESVLNTCLSFNADRSGEATNQPSLFGTPMDVESALQTPTTNATQKRVSFNVDRSGDATNQPSLFGTPMAVEPVLNTCVSFNDGHSVEAINTSIGTPMNAKSALQTPTTDSSQKSVSVNVDDSNEANKPSSVETPMAVESASKTPTTNATQKRVSFNVDSSGEVANKSSSFGTPMTAVSALNTCVSFNDGHSVEAINTSFGTPMNAKSALQTPTTDSTQKSVSFNVDDSDEAKKPSFFGTPVTAKSALKTPTANGTTSNNDEEVVTHAHDQMLQMQQELESAKAEVENYKKAAEIAKKEADDFQFVMDEEKRRSNNRIADLRKQNLALCDEVEALRGGGSGDGKRQKLSDDFDEDGSAANTIKSLREQLAKAVGEIEGYRTKVKMSQKEIDDMKIALNAEKYARHDEVQKLKDDCDYHRNLNTSFQNVSTAAEAEAKLYKKRAKDAQQQVAELEAALAVEKKFVHDRIAKVRYEKDTEIDSLRDKIAQLGGQLEVANAEKEKMNEIVAQLYSDLDGVANDQKAYCETIFELQSKLVKFVKDGEQVRVPIDTTPAAPLSTIIEEESV